MELGLPVASETAFIVIVPEAEPYVRELRERFDPTAKQGVPAHITLLYPFMPPAQVDAAVLARAGATLSGADFFFRLVKVEHFPSATYLRPEPMEPFITLTKALIETFPAFLPYGGRYDGTIPHLTVAQDAYDREIVTKELKARLPERGVDARCKEITLIENSSGFWKRMHSFVLIG